MTDSLHNRVICNFEKQGLMQTLGAKLEEINHGHCVISSEINTKADQQHGFAHAGLSFSIGDSAAGYAALSVAEENTDIVSVEMKINMLRPAVGRRLIATGSVLRAGRKIITVRADIESETEDGTRKLVAAMQGTMMPINEN